MHSRIYSMLRPVVGVTLMEAFRKADFHQRKEMATLQPFLLPRNSRFKTRFNRIQFAQTIFGLMFLSHVVDSTTITHPKEDLSFVDPRLTLIPEAEIVGASRPETLIILHIAKTGITTLDYLLRVLNYLGNKAREQPDFYLPQAKVFPTMIRDIIQDVKENGRLISPHKVGPGWIGGIKIAVEEDLKTDKAFYKNYNIITGHMPYGLHEYGEFNKPVDYAIVVGEPCQRLLSLINFEYQRGLLDEFTTAEEKYDYWLNLNIDNLQTRMAAGVKYMSGECTEETLQVAKANIEKFKVAGVTDDIEGFIQAVVAHYPGIGSLAICRQQVTGVKLFNSSQEVPKALEEKIRAKNTYDAELYLWVKKRWYEYKSKYVREKPSIEYLSVRADAKNSMPTYESKSQINNYNTFFNKKYQGKPVNVKDFSSKEFFDSQAGSKLS
ncbi:MAG: hypothetical protein JSR33_07235 [Proteobacteria bacterium]|nr:hypothetical protein [Pseudomonadota bacterium]